MWSLINARNNFLKLTAGIGFLFVFILISGCSQGTSGKAYDQPYYRELSLFRHAGDLLEQDDFSGARQLYQQFLEKYPKHPYADDAAYRIAYMHVMVADNNPYFDYKKAYTVFQNFIETYQNSHYISACKNWISVLDYRKHQSQAVAGKTAGKDPITNASISEEIRRLKEENARLKENLQQLQQAIER